MRMAPSLVKRKEAANLKACTTKEYASQVLILYIQDVEGPAIKRKAHSSLLNSRVLNVPQENAAAAVLPHSLTTPSRLSWPLTTPEAVARSQQHSISNHLNRRAAQLQLHLSYTFFFPQQGLLQMAILQSLKPLIVNMLQSSIALPIMSPF